MGGPALLAELAEGAAAVHVSAEIRAYILDLTEATRHHPNLTVGASPRASLALLRAATGFAVTAGRAYVVPDDVKAVAVAVLGHRLAPTAAAELGGFSSLQLVHELLATVPVRVPSSAPTN